MADAFSTAETSATQTLHPRQWMTPGWYWAFLEPKDAGIVWSAFTKANPSVRTTRTVGTGSGTAGEKGAWVLFQVTGTSPVIWTLPGLPSKALKGGDTEYQDVVDIPKEEQSGTEMLDGFFGGLNSHLGLAGKALLWGGVGIVLWRLLQATDAVTPRRSRKEAA